MPALLRQIARVEYSKTSLSPSLIRMEHVMKKQDIRYGGWGISVSQIYISFQKRCRGPHCHKPISPHVSPFLCLCPAVLLLSVVVMISNSNWCYPKSRGFLNSKRTMTCPVTLSLKVSKSPRALEKGYQRPLSRVHNGSESRAFNWLPCRQVSASSMQLQLQAATEPS